MIWCLPNRFYYNFFYVYELRHRSKQEMPLYDSSKVKKNYLESTFLFFAFNSLTNRIMQCSLNSIDLYICLQVGLNVDFWIHETLCFVQSFRILAYFKLSFFTCKPDIYFKGHYQQNLLFCFMFSSMIIRGYWIGFVEEWGKEKISYTTGCLPHQFLSLQVWAVYTNCNWQVDPFSTETMWCMVSSFYLHHTACHAWILIAVYMILFVECRFGQLCGVECK